jgi:hypothetical protein
VVTAPKPTSGLCREILSSYANSGLLVIRSKKMILVLTLGYEICCLIDSLNSYCDVANS